MRVLLHALLASDVIKVTSLASSSPPLPQLRAISPQVHLDNFLRHSSSPASSASSSVAAVTARPVGADDCSWELVGAVSSCAAPSEGDIARGLDFNECALFAAVQVQQRLISEHACRIHHHLRAVKRAPGIELGLSSRGSLGSLPQDGSAEGEGGNKENESRRWLPVNTRAVPPSAMDGEPPDYAAVCSAGFVGEATRGKGSSLYREVWEAVVAASSERAATRRGEEAAAAKEDGEEEEDSQGKAQPLLRWTASKDGVLPRAYFESFVYRRGKGAPGSSSPESAAVVPWDTGGRPQPCVVSAAERGAFAGAWVLDCGCGAGENAAFLAASPASLARGVVGFDVSPDAVAAAEERIGAAAAEEASQRFGGGRPSSPVGFVVASCTDMAAEASPVRRRFRELQLLGSSGSSGSSGSGSGGGSGRDDSTSTSTSTSNEEEEDDDGLFDVALDSALLHCLSDADAKAYVGELSRLVARGTGRALVGCFSDKNPDPWDNPRRLSEGYLRGLFCKEAGWEVTRVRDTWWSRPTGRGSAQGSFCMALWMEARRL